MLRRIALLSLLLLAGCAQNPAGLPLWQAKEVAPPSLQYLGVAGYLLRWQGEALLFAPSFSNPATLGQPRLRLPLPEGEAWVYPQWGLTVRVQDDVVLTLQAVPKRAMQR